MKILTKSLFILLCSSVVVAQSQNIPDANFAAAIRAICPTCLDNSNKLLADAKNVAALYLTQKNIANLAGIEGFTKLDILYCSHNPLTTLPTLPSMLTYLQCSYSRLTSVPPTMPTGLKHLDLSNNLLPTLPATLPNSVTDLIVNNNQITTLPTLPTSLQNLYCFSTPLKKLPNLPNTLQRLLCFDTQITLLPTLPPSLIMLQIDAARVTCLPNIVNGLAIFDAANNAISMPPICPTTAVSTVESGVRVYPNPLSISENLTVEMTNREMRIDEIEIVNALGQVIFSKKPAANAVQIDLSAQTTGVFIVRGWVDSKQFVSKIIRK